jgi:ABC-type sugar transport system ATPase subunit
VAAEVVVPLIETRGLGMRFAGVPALRDVDFSARAGEVHAIVGANGAGKSTLIKLLSGALQPSQGRILLEGRDVRFGSPRQAQEAGIGTVYQELTLVPQLTVAENLFLGREPLRMGCWLDRRRRRENACALLGRFGFALDPDVRVDALGIADRQLLEIARALSLDNRVLILDEPTAVLSVPEQRKLFDIIRQLRSQGVTVLYISHRLEEIFTLSDRVSVFRDGRLRSTADTAVTTEADIVRQMVGEIGSSPGRAEARAAFPGLLEVSYVRDGTVNRLRVGAGEIVGVAGFVGAGRSRLARRIAGDDDGAKSDGISVVLNGQPVARRGIAHAARAGIVYVTEDRKRDGLFGPLRAVPNVSAASLSRVARFGWLRFAQERQRSQAPLQQLRLATGSENVPVHALSGGNQQKVVFARALLQSPRLLICDEPTRGVDVGAKQEIYAFLRSLAAQGVGVLVISSEFAELNTLCDRIVVMFEGRLARDLPAAQANEELLLMAASGVATEAP